jgi:hypothetical protein
MRPRTRAAYIRQSMRIAATVRIKDVPPTE